METTVHEASVDPYPLPRACKLDAEIMRIFQGAGLSDQVTRIVEPCQGMDFVDSEGKRLFTYEDFQRSPILGWFEDYVFQQPPEQISSRHATRKSVLEPLEPGALRQLLGDAEVTRQARVHQQWDPDDAPYLSFWLMGLPEAEREPAMRARFERAPSGRTWLIWSRMASPEAVEARCANAAPPFVAAVCSKDAASIARAANGDPWLHLLAGDAAVRAGNDGCLALLLVAFLAPLASAFVALLLAVLRAVFVAFLVAIIPPGSLPLASPAVARIGEWRRRPKL